MIGVSGAQCLMTTVIVINRALVGAWSKHVHVPLPSQGSEKNTIYCTTYRRNFQNNNV